MSRCRLKLSACDCHFTSKTSEISSHHPRKDVALRHIQTRITITTSWVCHRNVKQISNMGTDKINIKNSVRIQEKGIQELDESRNHSSKDCRTRKRQGHCSSSKDKGSVTGSPESVQGTTEVSSKMHMTKKGILSTTYKSTRSISKKRYTDPVRHHEKAILILMLANS